MTKAEVFRFLNRNPVFFLATQNLDQPRVRAMRLMKADENGIVFYTSTLKDLYRQLQGHHKVELCFLDRQEERQVRVDGNVELSDDLELRKTIVEKQPFLIPIVEKNGYEVIAPYFLRDAKAFVWDMKSNFLPKTYIRL